MLAAGIGAADLAQGPLRELSPSTAAQVPIEAGEFDPIATLLTDFPTGELRRLGLGVDRQSLVLQPPWRSDEQAVEHLGRRPFGPAHVTMLHLRGPLAAAAAAGCGTAALPAAKAELAAAIARARNLVARRGPATVWLVALGEPIAVAHTIDVAAIARQLVGWPYARELAVHTTTATARIVASGRRAIDELRRRLADSALGGATVLADSGGLWLLAPPCTAFGRRPVFARSPHQAERRAAALLPAPLRTAASLTFAGLAARLAMAAAAGAEDRRRRGQQPANAVAAANADLLPLSADAAAPATSLFALEPEPSEFDDVLPSLRG